MDSKIFRNYFQSLVMLFREDVPTRCNFLRNRSIQIHYSNGFWVNLAVVDGRYVYTTSMGHSMELDKESSEVDPSFIETVEADYKTTNRIIGGVTTARTRPTPD